MTCHRFSALATCRKASGIDKSMPMKAATSRRTPHSAFPCSYSKEEGKFGAGTVFHFGSFAIAFLVGAEFMEAFDVKAALFEPAAVR